jgi:hypothetical protein
MRVRFFYAQEVPVQPSSLDAAMKKAKDLYLSGDYQGAWGLALDLPDADKRAAFDNPDHKRLLTRIAVQSGASSSGLTLADLGLRSGAGQSPSSSSDASSALTSAPAESPEDILYPRLKKGKVTF